MSFIISNKATKRQIEILTELEYTGRGKYATENLTIDEASKLIDELFTEKRYSTQQIQEIAGDWYHMPIVEVAGHSPEDIEDPFSSYNKKENKR